MVSSDEKPDGKKIDSFLSGGASTLSILMRLAYLFDNAQLDSCTTNDSGSIQLVLLAPS